MLHVDKTPVLLLTGYLGSGKTTLLNRILQNRQGIRFAVIVNDIGEVNIDADLIQRGGVVSQEDDSLVALQNGCICCSLKQDMLLQLHDLIASHQFDYIVIEASGICEPVPIAQTIMSYASMMPQTMMDGVPQLDAIVSVVDALRLRDEFASGADLQRPVMAEDDIASLVIQQIEFCNVILLNKASEVSADELAHIRAVIRAIQPTAEIVETDYCEVDFDRILHTGLFDFDRVATSATWIKEVENREEEHEHEHHHKHHHEHGEHCHCHECEHHHHDHDHNHGDEYGISTYVYYARRPFRMGMFDSFVASLWPKSVIRAKGMCYFEEEYDMCYLFEQSGHQFNLRQAGQWFATMPKEELMQLMASDEGLQKDWDEHYGDRMQKLVFIGQHMDHDEIKRALDTCLA